MIRLKKANLCAKTFKSVDKCHHNVVQMSQTFERDSAHFYWRRNDEDVTNQGDSAFRPYFIFHLIH